MDVSLPIAQQLSVQIEQQKATRSREDVPLAILEPVVRSRPLAVAVDGSNQPAVTRRTAGGYSSLDRLGSP